MRSAPCLKRAGLTHSFEYRKALFALDALDYKCELMVARTRPHAILIWEGEDSTRYKAHGRGEMLVEALNQIGLQVEFWLSSGRVPNEKENL